MPLAVPLAQGHGCCCGTALQATRAVFDVIERRHPQSGGHRCRRRAMPGLRSASYVPQSLPQVSFVSLKGQQAAAISGRQQD